MFTFYPEEPEYVIYQPGTYYPRSQFSKCRYHNQPSCSYHSNPYSSYSHPYSDSYFSPSYNNRSYYRNNESGDKYRRQYHQSPFYNRNSNLQEESLFGSENFFNIQPDHIEFEKMRRRPQGRKSQNHGDELKRRSTTQNPKKSQSIPITIPSDSTNNSVKVNNSKTMALDKNQASKRIYKFLRHNTANYKTRKVLSKLLQLRNIQNHLTNLESQNDQLMLTFSAEQETSQVLPKSKNNKKFLEYEDNVLKALDKLDRIDSNGFDIVRERRKEVVALAQRILNLLDEEKESQWEEFKMIKRKGGENDIVIDKNVTIENKVSDNNTVAENSEMVEDNIVDDVNENKVIDEKVGERKIEVERVGTVNSPATVVSEDIEVDEVEDDITQSPALEGLEGAEIKPYTISEADGVKEIVIADEIQNDNALEDETTKDIDIDINSFVYINANESKDVDEPLLENKKSDLSSSFVQYIDQKEVSKVENINSDNEEKLSKEDEFVVIESNDSNE